MLDDPVKNIYRKWFLYESSFISEFHEK